MSNRWSDETATELIDEFIGAARWSSSGGSVGRCRCGCVCDLLGLPREMGDRIKPWSEAYLALAGRQLPKADALRAQEEVVELNNYIADELERRRSPANGGRDRAS